ncbi:MAG TPA: ROK family protein [Candidatus Limnocylindrales bacterium]
MTVAIGIDVGGSAIKAAAVDTETGRLMTSRLESDTPDPSTPDAVIDEVAHLVEQVEAALDRDTAPVAGDRRAVGVTLPCVVVDGVVKTAANIDEAWVDYPGADALSRRLLRPVALLNDADAAGIAEMRFGAGRDRRGTVIALTLGTGVGSAIFVDGRLVPNTELGHMELRGDDAEHRSAAIVRVREKLSWEAWAANLDEHLHAIHRLFWPTLFILGGGISADADRFLPLLTVPCEVVAARLRNDAGATGAAMTAAQLRR